MSAWLTVAAIADDLGVSARTVLRWIDRGDLRAVRLPGGRMRIAQADLAAMLDAGATTRTRGRMVAVVTDREDANDADG